MHIMKLYTFINKTSKKRYSKNFINRKTLVHEISGHERLAITTEERIDIIEMFFGYNHCGFYEYDSNSKVQCKYVWKIVAKSREMSSVHNKKRNVENRLEMKRQMWLP